MSVLVDDLLLLARLDEGRPLEREPVELERVVAEAVETARTVEPDRPIELESSPPSCSATATGCARSSTTCSRTSAPHTPAGSAGRGELAQRERRRA